MRVALGFDTSCYTTSAAAVDEHGAVVAAERMLLPVREGQRGLRQSEAVFAHVRQMPKVMEMLGSRLDGAQIVAVCASARPRDGEDSYMPVFTVGLGHASVLASTLGVPVYETSHQQGHIAAGLIGNAAPEGPFVALHLSGGTTELLDCREGALTLLGGSEDLHAGQLVDRVGVALGLPFPAGPALERLATVCPENTSALLPTSVSRDGLSCHLSGVETQVQRLIQAGDLSRERIAAEVYDVLARTVARLLDGACRRTGARQALVVGGVASSALLRRLAGERLSRLRSPVRVLYGQAQYSADNAAGVASIGMRRYLEKHS
ncbi:MAG: O-sialoglycoprotein endopeptidase [Clostridiales bacterium]|nr:O-sialoglycoprotein endopeptidase [Clostridiales bacterium]